MIDTSIMVAAEGVASGGSISDALSDVTTVFNAAVNMVTGNTIAMVFIGMSIAGAAFALFRKARK